MIFQQLFDPTSSTYTYVLARRVGGEALVVDPVLEQVEVYLTLFERLKLKLVKALDTHIHADHVTGLGRLRDLTRCVTVMGERSGADVVSMRVREGETIDVDGLRLKTLYTPGHTDDSYSFTMEDRVFTGDALLIGGTGRTDFQNGDPYAGYDSLFGKLLRLPDETLVYPAHDYRGNTASTIGQEKRLNPRLQVKSAQEYADLMNSLHLPNPKMMDIAVPANRTIGESLRKFVSPEEELGAEACLQHRGEVVLVDLRETTERARDGTIPGSIHAPYGGFEDQVQPGGLLHHFLREHAGHVVLFCAFGERSALALDAARQAGLHGLRHMKGGFADWLRVGGQVEFSEP